MKLYSLFILVCFLFIESSVGFAQDFQRIKLEKQYSEGKIIHKEQNSLHGHHKRTERSTSNKILLTNFNNIQYYGKVKFGSDNQEYKVIFDTGSNTSWIPEKYSGENTCAKKYKPFKSTSFQDFNTLEKILYMKGNATVRLGSDSVTIGNMTVMNQTFGLAIKSDCESKEYEGIIGLSFHTINHSSIIENMLSQGLIKEPIFAFYLNRNRSSTDSELTIGGYNPKYIKNNEQITVKVTDPVYWQVPLEEVKLGQHIIALDQKAIIDSGTSIIVAPSLFLQNVLDIMEYYDVDVRQENGYLWFAEYSFQNLPNISFTLGNNIYTLTNKDYNIYIDEADAIGIYFDDSLRDTWVLGELFFQKYYLIFDYGKRTISFPKTRSIIVGDSASRGNFMNSKRSEEIYKFIYLLIVYQIYKYF